MELPFLRKKSGMSSGVALCGGTAPPTKMVERGGQPPPIHHAQGFTDSHSPVQMALHGIVRSTAHTRGAQIINRNKIYFQILTTKLKKVQQPAVPRNANTVGLGRVLSFWGVQRGGWTPVYNNFLRREIFFWAHKKAPKRILAHFFKKKTSIKFTKILPGAKRKRMFGEFKEFPVCRVSRGFPEGISEEACFWEARVSP